MMVLKRFQCISDLADTDHRIEIVNWASLLIEAAEQKGISLNFVTLTQIFRNFQHNNNMFELNLQLNF